MKKPPPKPNGIPDLTPEELREIQERPKDEPLTPRQAVQINRAFTRNKPDTLT